MEYKGYNANVRYSDEDECLVGEVIGLRDGISFHGNSVKECKKEFKNAVDTYLEYCKKKGIKPDRQYSGKFNLRINPEVHRDLDKFASIRGVSLNEATTEIIQAFFRRHESEMDLDDGFKQMHRILESLIGKPKRGQVEGSKISLLANCTTESEQKVFEKALSALKKTRSRIKAGISEEETGQ